MNIEQKPCTKFERKLEGTQEISLICSNDVPLGVVHDFLMEMKGWCVDRMVTAHKEEEKISEEQFKQCEELCE